MKTKEVKTEGGKVTIKRLSFGQMRELGPKIEALYEKETPSDVLYDEDFETVMKAAAASDEDFETLMGELDQSDVWQVWEAFCDHQRVKDFLFEAANSQSQRVADMYQMQLDQQRKQLEMMQKSGLVPKDFSIDTAMQKAADKAAEQILSQRASKSGSSTEEPKAAKGTSKKR